ncbi:hypothetical protein HY008_02780 [Candidatus Woesebacteria bacterium]|nr:hypothetical protein [Candidatus Woesebacteria bacterium]
MKIRLIIVSSLCLAVLITLLVSQTPPFSPRLRRLFFSKSLAPYLADMVPPSLNFDNKPNNVPAAQHLDIKHYILQTSLPKATDASTIYEFKHLKREDAIDFAKRLLGENPNVRDQGQELIISSKDKQDAILVIDQVTGMFSYKAKNPPPVLSLPKDGNPAAVVANYLREKQLIDDTVAATAYYRTSQNSQAFFVEFHRLWEHVGAPIINVAGILNTSLPLDNLSLTFYDNNQTSDQPRRNGFNTLTAMVSDDGRVLGITSTLRTIAKKQTLSASGFSLLDPQKIIAELKKNGFLLGYAVAKSPSSSFTNLYSNNQVKITNAHITDIVLVYEEKPLGVPERFLIPTYIIRGTGTSEAGETAFTQTVPALEVESAFPPPAEAQTQAPGLKFGSYDPESTRLNEEAKTPEISPPLIAVSLRSQTAGCQAIDQATNMTYDPSDRLFVPGIGTLVMFRSIPPIANQVFFQSPTPNLVANAQGLQMTIEGIEITSPCLIMPAN